MPCSKIHKNTHENNIDKQAAQSAPLASEGEQQPADQTAQINGQLGFDGFENDPELRRLLSRFPHLRHELQLVYGVTIEPGPDEVHTWAKQKWFDDGSARHPSRMTGSRSGRGRSRGGFRVGSRARQGDMAEELPVEQRQHGPWTQSKGDKQGMDLLRKLRGVSHPELSEGMLEFIRLCSLRFG